MREVNVIGVIKLKTNLKTERKKREGENVSFKMIISPSLKVCVSTELCSKVFIILKF